MATSSPVWTLPSGASGMTSNLARGQVLRYAVVGLVSNVILYCAYIALTRLTIEPKIAMSMTFCLGVAATFLANSRWTFKQRGGRRAAYGRYWLVYGLAYLLNLAMLALFVDVLGFRHQIVQGVLVFVIAAALFLTQKFWIFRRTAAESDPRAGSEVCR